MKKKMQQDLKGKSSKRTTLGDYHSKYNSSRPSRCALHHTKICSVCFLCWRNMAVPNRPSWCGGPSHLGPPRPPSPSCRRCSTTASGTAGWPCTTGPPPPSGSSPARWAGPGGRSEANPMRHRLACPSPIVGPGPSRRWSIRSLSTGLPN